MHFELKLFVVFRLSLMPVSWSLRENLFHRKSVKISQSEHCSLALFSMIFPWWASFLYCVSLILNRNLYRIGFCQNLVLLWLPVFAKAATCEFTLMKGISEHFAKTCIAYYRYIIGLKVSKLWPHICLVYCSLHLQLFCSLRRFILFYI